MADDTRQGFAEGITRLGLLGGAGYLGYRALQKVVGTSEFDSLVEQVRVSSTLGRATASGIGDSPPGLQYMTRGTTSLVDVSQDLERFFASVNSLPRESGKDLMATVIDQALLSSKVMRDSQRKIIVDKLRDVASPAALAEEIKKMQTDGTLRGVTGDFRERFRSAGRALFGVKGQVGLSDALTNAIAKSQKSGVRLPNMAGSRGITWMEYFFPGGNIAVSNPAFFQPAGSTPQVVNLQNFVDRARKQLNDLGLGYDVSLGRQTPGRAGTWESGIGTKLMEFPEVGMKNVDIQHAQIRITSREKGSLSEAILDLPITSEMMASRRSTNLISRNGTGMAFSSLPKFAIPVPGGGYQVHQAMDVLQMMLTGDSEKGVAGLALTLHQMKQEGKGLKDLQKAWKAMIDSVSQPVSTTKSGLRQARLESNLVMPVPDLLSFALTGRGKEMSLQENQAFVEGLIKSGYQVALPASPELGVSGKYFAALQGEEFYSPQTFDAFGRYYPQEKRYFRRERADLHLSSRAERNINHKGNRILGLLGRRDHLTLTPLGREVSHRGPMGIGIFTLDRAGQATTVGQEQGWISGRIKNVLEMRKERFLTVFPDRIGEVGVNIPDGHLIGVDFFNAEEVRSRTAGGQVKHRIVNKPTRVGEMAFINVETEIPLGNVTKLDGDTRGSFHRVGRGKKSGDLSKVLEANWGITDSLSRRADIVGHASEMKGGRAAVLKQMTEAMWLSGASKYADIEERLKPLRKAGQTVSTANVARTELGEGLFQFVVGAKTRRRLLERVNKVAERADFQEMARLGVTELTDSAAGKGAMSAGIELLREAKRFGFTSPEFATMGGLFWQNFAKDPDSRAALAAELYKAGLKKSDIEAMEMATHVYALPDLTISHNPYTMAWKTGSIEPRGLREILARQWPHEGGQAMVDELLTRVDPGQSLVEMDRAVRSLIGDSSAVPGDIRKIESAKDALRTFEEGEFASFVYTGQGRSMYVPGSDVARMGDFRPKVGSKPITDGLQTAYKAFFQAIESGAPVEAAEGALRGVLQSEYLRAGRAGGEVLGSTGLFASRWWTEMTPGGRVKEFTPESFLKSSEAFEIGLSETRGKKMLQELLDASKGEEQRAFMRGQIAAFERGDAITGMVARHPFMRPGSMLPARIRKVVGGDDNVFYLPKFILRDGADKFDVTQAVLMKMDFDGDTGIAYAMSDEKRAAALEKMMNDTRFKSQYLDDIHATVRLQATAQEMATQGKTGAAGFIQALQSLVGVKLKTGQVSNLANELRLAANFSLGDRPKDRDLLSFVISEFEESAISSKKGLFSEAVIDNLNIFRQSGPGSREALEEAWNTVYGVDQMKLRGDQSVEKKWFLDTMSGAMEKANDNSDFRSFVREIRATARAYRGDASVSLSSEQLINFVKGKQMSADPLSAATRSIQVGDVGSQIGRNRSALAAVEGFGSSAWRTLRPYGGLAIGAGIIGAGAIAASQSVDNSVQELAGMRISPKIPAPATFINRLITGGGAAFPPGYSTNGQVEYSSAGARRFSAFLGSLGNSSARIRDDRGAITPEYIRKATEERYW